VNEQVIAYCEAPQRDLAALGAVQHSAVARKAAFRRNIAAQIVNDSVMEYRQIGGARMAITVGKYQFDGPHTSTGKLQDRRRLATGRLLRGPAERRETLAAHR
jgi:hypothetical protein